MDKIDMVIDVNKPGMIKLMVDGELWSWIRGSTPPSGIVMVFGFAKWSTVAWYARQVDGGDFGVIELSGELVTYRGDGSVVKV